MTLSSSYKSGTITVSAGGTQVFGTGTNWTGFGVREGDIIWAGGIDVAVASVEGPTALTLAFPWAGPALSGSPYEIRPTPDASRVLTASREAIESLETIQGDLYASANVYSTIVEGLAATATGSQFQVAQGTEIVRFVKTAPGFATELARYMTAPGVTAAVAQATAKDAALTLAIRDGAVLPLTNIGGTGDAITADLQATMIAAGITTLSAIAEVEYIPVAGNTLTDPTLTVAGVTYTIKDFDGGVWPAGGFVANRIYKLRRRGMTLRVTSGNLSRTDVAAQISIEATARAAGDTASRDRANHSGVQPITTVTGLSAALDGLSQARADGDAAEESARTAGDRNLSLALRDGVTLPLTNIAGTGDAITADLQATMVNADITTLSVIAEVEYIPTATNTSANPTITIAGVTYGIRDADGGTWPAGGFSTARIYKLRRRSSVMRVVSGAVIPADLTAEATARAAGDTASRDRANHTGAQSITTVTGLSAALDGLSQARADGDAALSDRLEVGFGPIPIDRGDTGVFASISGVPVGAFDAAGRLLAMPSGALVTATFSGATEGDAGLLMAKMGGTMDRGDGAAIYTLNGSVVVAMDKHGRIDMRLADDALADISQRLDLDGLTIATAPQSPDLIGNYDGWDVWQRDGLTYFTGLLPGYAQPRGYVLRAGGQAWAVAPSAMRVRLVYGDHTADTPTSLAPDHAAHIATLGDGAGQAGLAGAALTATPADLARAGLGFAGLSAERTLDDATGALRRYGVRSEAVPGATLAALRAGQPMTNLVRARTEFARLNGLYGGTAGVESVTVLHGGGAATAAGYAADLVALAGEIVTRTGAAQVNIVPPGGTWQSGTDPAILGAVEALRTRGAVPLVLVSPLHWCGVRSGTLGSPDAVSMTMLAELDALATAAGRGWHGPIAVAATRSGSTVNVDFEVMPGAALVAPTYGVSYSGAAITAMTVVADPTTTRLTRLQITLASAAPGTLRIAFGASGSDQTKYANRCDLRDDWSAASSTGQTLRRYAHPAQFEVS